MFEAAAAVAAAIAAAPTAAPPASSPLGIFGLAAFAGVTGCELGIGKSVACGSGLNRLMEPVGLGGNGMD